MKTTLIGVAAWLLAVSTASADVQLTMQNGRVTLVAKDANVRQILAEWARVGHTKIVNLEAVPGGPITLELQKVYWDTVRGRSERYHDWLDFAAPARAQA
jgi:hypothetical protein